MKAIVLGSGGREHALAWKISQSPLVDQLYWAPGNAGYVEKCKKVSLDLEDFPEIANFIRKEAIGLVVIGPEQPLVKGLTDYLRSQEGLSDIHIIGPTKAGAQLEGSKDFAKAFMLRHQIPTTRHKTFTREEIGEARRYITDIENPPYVLKADGLAAGKGVLISGTEEEALKDLETLFSGKFGQASERVVVESFLHGIECSVFVLTDGTHYTLLPTAKDYKRIGEADTGPNTGGMGAVSPVPFADTPFMQKVEERIIRPTIEGLREEGIKYQGFIFFGLIRCGEDPYVIEYNCRLGDPETEVVMLCIEGDIVPALLSLKDQSLQSDSVRIASHHATTVVAVSGGYPGEYKSGETVLGLDKANDTNTHIFHAGTRENGQGKILTSGGRVLAVSAIGSSLKEAIERSYEKIMSVCFKGMYYRKDIGLDIRRMQ